MEEKEGALPSWFKSPWLYIECYMYRKIALTFETCKALPNFDPFQYLKDQAFIGSLPTIHSVAKFLKYEMDRMPTSELLLIFLQMTLWSNRCDLSISGGETDIAPGDLMAQLTTLRSDYLLVDDLDTMTSFLANLASSPPDRLDIILDNAGYELFCDLCLVEILLAKKLVKKVYLHGKFVPWFVSDTTARDFAWTLEMCRNSNCEELNQLGHKLHERLESDQIVFRADTFYTLPCDFTRLAEFAPSLTEELCGSSCVIFKGDLNYRKLVGDLAWPPTVTFKEALRSNPLVGNVPLVALRTLKADVVVGLKPGVAEDLGGKDSTWMLTGKYGVAHFLA